METQIRVWNDLRADVTAQIGLNLHAFFRAHKDFPAVNVGRKIHALFLDFAQGRKGKHLKSAGVRKNGAVPGHKLMQAAHLPNHFVRGS